jgi:inner membrane protein
MDSLTHIALGACIGEAFFEKGFGKKAIGWGALAQSIPDIDFVAGTWLSSSQNLLAHRGITHSLLFAVLVVPLFAWLANTIHKPHRTHLKKWLLFFAAEVLLHLLLDGFNNYGVGWLEPFSQQRFSFNSLYVADPFFSAAPGIACLVLMLLNKHHPLRTLCWRLGVLLPFIYLCYCVYNKVQIDKEVKQIFARQQIPQQRYFTTPAPFQNWLWYTVAATDSGYYAGYRSVFDTQPTMHLQFFARNQHLLAPVIHTAEVQQLTRFSQQYYTVEQWHDTLVFNDLRFGQVLGWQNPTAPFAFHYYLQHPLANKLVVQRGRFAKWDKQALLFFIKKIKGN